jgi:hypothetical protein
MDEEEVQDLKHQVEKIFEDDDVLIVSPLTNEANVYYGGQGPFYEEGYYGNREFEKRLENGGKIYHIINKKTGEKDSFYKDEYGQIFYNDITKVQKSDIEELIKFAPTAKRVIVNLTSSEIFRKLRQYAKRKLDVTTLENSDDLIHDVIQDRENPAGSTILLRFEEDEDLFNILDLSDDDIWFLNVIMSRDYEFMDSDRMWEDNKEGYGIFRWFNGENMQKLRDISRIVIPNEEFNEQSEQFMGNLYRKLDEHFERQLNNMCWTYIEDYNDVTSDRARTEISKEIDEYLNEKGFSLVRKYDTLSIGVSDLIYLYSITGRRSDNLKELLEGVLKPSSKDRFGGWGESYYEYEGKVDFDKLNNEFEFQLEKIWDVLTEDDDMKEYFELYDRITSKYKLNTNYSTPKDYNITFKIKSIDPETKKITAVLSKKNIVWDKTHSFTEENFNKFLHQPELFSIFDEN